MLLVYRTHHAHQTLLGQVPLGNHPAGLSHITWGLRVNGHRLATGDYLAELEVRLAPGVLTTGGPTVSFHIRHRHTENRHAELPNQLNHVLTALTP